MLIRRIFAFLIDAVVAFLFSLLPIVGWLMGFLYMLLRDGLTEKGSPGKKLIDLQVTTNNGGRVTFRESIHRNIIFAFPVLLSIIPIVGSILAGLFGLVIYVMELLAINNDPNGRRNGDRWADTIVKEIPSYY